MIDKESVLTVTQDALEQLGNDELFIVEVNVRPDNEIEIILDSDSSVSVDECIEISRLVESKFDRDTEDFSLTVSSSGIGQPLKILRQYLKLAGQSVEVVLNDGTKILGTLETADAESITVSYPEKRTVEGKKRPEKVVVTRQLPLSEVKSTKEYLDFK